MYLLVPKRDILDVFEILLCCDDDFSDSISHTTEA